MFRVNSWLYGRKTPAAGVSSIDVLTEVQDLEHAMHAATLILNDDVDGAEDRLAERDSSFHKVGKGIVAFIRASLGFEQDVMRQASERLGDAEVSCAADQQKARLTCHAPNKYRSQIYVTGTEFALCQAVAQMMSAVVGVLNESLTESIRGFYKMRKAYITLDGILKMEETFIRKKKALAAPSSLDSVKSGHDVASDEDYGLLGTQASGPTSPELMEEKFHLDVDAAEELAASRASTGTSTPSDISLLDHDPDSDVFSNPLDAFIHSGANCCFGVLLLIISMVPPTFSKILGIIGFRGDKPRGLRMLWQASKFHNVMGAMAALALLNYYNGFVRYCDIMPDVTSSDHKGFEGYPRARLVELMTEMRKRFPNSQLWLLEDSRMNGANKNLRVALDLLQEGQQSTLQQVEALKVFEKGLNSMYLHEYELCTDSFLECVELNSWSHALYYYIAGSAQLSLYRRHAKEDSAAASQHSQKAVEYLTMAPKMSGKKRFMAKQLPFDVFVTRRVAKWEARAKEWKVDLVDAIGVDPLEEMIFFWNGHSHMTKEQLECSLANLDWCASDRNATWSRQAVEEGAILHLLRSAIYRAQRRHSEAEEILRTRVLTLDKAAFKGQVRDDWVLPVAHFEIAANVWMQRPGFVDMAGGSSSSDLPSDQSKVVLAEADTEKVEREMVRECRESLEKVARWESFLLDTRIGLKVTAGLEAVQKWEDAHPV